MAGSGADDEPHSAAEDVMQEPVSTDSPSLPPNTSTVGPTVNGIAPRLRYDGVGTGNNPNGKRHLRPAWRKGESGNPLGPRAGSRHVQQAQAELRKAAPEMARKAVDLGRADDGQMVRYVLDQALGKAVSRTEALSVNVDLGAAGTSELLQALQAALGRQGIDLSDVIEGEWAEAGIPDDVPDEPSEAPPEADDAK